MLRFDAVDAAAGTSRLHGGGHPGDEASASDADDDHIDVRHVLDQFEPERAVSGDDLRVVEGMHEGEAFHVSKTLHLRKRVTDVRAMEHDPRPVAEARVDLRANGALRHHDGDRHPGGRPAQA